MIVVVVVIVRAVGVVAVVESCARVVLSGLVYFPGGHPAYATQNTLIKVRMLSIVAEVPHCITAVNCATQNLFRGV